MWSSVLLNQARAVGAYLVEHILVRSCQGVGGSCRKSRWTPNDAAASFVFFVALWKLECVLQ